MSYPKVIKFSRSYAGHDVKITIPDLSPWKQYWLQNTEVGPLLQIISDHCINIPFVDQPKEKIVFHLNQQNCVIYRPHHGTAQALRRYVYCCHYLEWLKIHSVKKWRQTIFELTREEIECLLIAAYCFRLGRTNDYKFNEDDTYAARSAEIFKCLTLQLGFSPMLIEAVSHCFFTHIPHDDISEILNPKNYLSRGFTGRTQRQINKAILIKKILDMGHDVDLLEKWYDEKRLSLLLGEHIYFFLDNYEKNICIVKDFVELALQQAQNFNLITGTNIIKGFFGAYQPNQQTFDTEKLYQTYYNVPNTLRKLQKSSAIEMNFRTLEKENTPPSSKKIQPIQDIQKTHFLYKVIPLYRWNIVLRGLLGERFPLRYMEEGPLAIPYRRKDNIVVLKNGQYRIIQNFHQKKEILERHEQDEQSTHQSLCYVNPKANYFPDIFDGNLLVKDETLPLVGLRFSPEDTEIQRIFLGDIHQGHRPYDLDHDISNFSLQRKVDDREWLSSLEELSQIGVMRMQYGHANYNEIIGRVRWDFTFETSHICIFHDNLETRLLAQLRAKDLLYTYRDKYPQDIPTHYQVPISFYRHLQTISKLTYYSLSEQLNDIKRAEEQTIHIDYLALLNIEDDSFCFENYNIENIKQVLTLAQHLSPATGCRLAIKFIQLPLKIQHEAIETNFDFWITIFAGLNEKQQEKFINDFDGKLIFNQFTTQNRSRGLPDEWLHKLGAIIHHTKMNVADKAINQFIDEVKEAKNCFNREDKILLGDNINMDYYLSGDDEKRKRFLLEINTVFDKVSNDYLISLLCQQSSLHPGFIRLGVHHLFMSSSPFHQLQIIEQAPQLIKSQIQNATSFKLYQQFIYDKNVLYALYQLLSTHVARYQLVHTLDELAEIIEQIANYALENHLPDNEINQFIVNLELDKIYLDTRANKLSNQEMCGLLFRFPELSNIIIAHAFNVNLFWSDETVQAEVENLRETLDIEDWIKKASPVHTDVQHFLEISGLYAPMHKLEQ